MISTFAMDEIEAMQADGYNLTARDIVRLNALALKVEEARGRDVTHSEYLLPRVAMLKDGVYFSQPLVGHEVWIQSALRWVDANDYQTILALNCFALSRSVADLPDANDPGNVAKAMADFVTRMAEFSTDQLYTAVNYVKFGCNHTQGECVGGKEEDGDDTVEDLKLDWEECVAVGSLREGVAVLWGLSLAEMREMTREELNAAIRRSYWFHGKNGYFKDAENTALGNYYKAKNEIKERLGHGTAPSV